MIRGRMLGVVAMLAAFGVTSPPPPPEPEVDLGEAEKVMDELHAAGINSLEVMEAAGDPSRFVATARRCLAAHAFLAGQGEVVTDVGRLLAPDSYVQAEDRPVDKPLPSTPHPRHQWMTSEADRGMVMQTTGGPVDFRRAGEESRARRVVIDRPGPASPAPLRYSAEPRLHPAGRCTCEGAGAGTCDWCEMNRRRELREGRPVMRDQQRKAGKARSKKKARRGW